MKNSILSVGSMAFDSIQSPAGKADSVLGGSVNYFSVAASLFSPVQIVAVVGEDFPKEHLQWLESRKIDTKGVEIAKGKTFHWSGSYVKDLNEAETLNTELNVFENFSPQLSDAQKEAQYLFLANINPELQDSVYHQMNGPGLVACDTMNLWININLDAVKKTLEKVDVLSINDTEAYLLSKKKNLISAAKEILKMGPHTLIIKRGEFGAALITDEQTCILPAFPTETVVDPTGAGDSFAGGFMGYLAQKEVTRDLRKSDPKRWNDSLRNAVVSGCVLASFTVEDFSLGKIKTVTQSDFEARKKQYLELIRVDSLS